VEQILSAKPIIAAILYALLGNFLLLVSFIIVDKLTPGDLWKELVVEKNMPLAITIGAMIVAIGHIIAAAIHG
jgi:putative membrane protein